MHRFFRKNRYAPRLGSQAASNILSNVFDACHAEHNTVPLETLESYSHYRRERFTLQRTIIILILIAFFLLPALFIPPTFTITESAAGSGKFEVAVQSILPVRRITATMGGRSLTVYETGDYLYSIEPTVNGTMTVTVESINNCTYSEEIEVNDVDTSAPVLLSSGRDGNRFYLYLSDADSGIDFEHIYAIDADGQTIAPVSVDEEASSVAFARTEGTLDIYIPDMAGNQLHLLVTVK